MGFYNDSANAAMAFLTWLVSLENAPLPGEVADLDQDLADFLSETLLVVDSQTRASCAKALDHPYFQVFYEDHDLTMSTTRSLDVFSDFDHQLSIKDGHGKDVLQ